MRHRAVVAAVFTCVVASVGAGCITDRVLTRTEDGGVTVDDEVVDRARLATSTLRGLPFEREVPLEVMSVADLEAWLNRYYDRAKEGLATRDRFFHKLGILPPTRDTASTWKGFVGGFAGGIYDDDRMGPDGQPGTMVLISDYAWWAKVQLDLFGLLTGVDYAYEVFLTHELTHALQDQHLHLDRLIDDAVDDDVRMVQKTVLESDANVVGMAHFAGVDLESLAGRTAFFWFLRYNNLLNGPMMQAAAGRTPSFFARQGFSQYELGLGFVEERLNAGDWQRFVGDDDGGAMAELSRSYARVPGSDGALPESTEQLLFPWKRGDSVDRPLRLAPLPLDVDPDDDDGHDKKEDGGAPAKPRFLGLELLDTGVFGALALKHWLEGPLQLGAEPVVDGWGGDRYELLVDGQGETLLFWRVLGDSATDAAQLADAVRDRLRAAHGPDRLDVVEERADDNASVYRATVRVAAEEQRFIRTTRPEHLLVERRGTAVVVVLGLSANEDVFSLRDRLFAVTVPTEFTAEDDVRRQTVARELDATLTRTIATRPVKAAPSLHDQLVLPARTMAVRVGAEARVIDADNVVITAAGEGRWGMRPWLELSLPLSATASARGGPFLVAAGLAPRGLPLLAPVDGLWSGRGLVTAAAAVGDLGATVQLEAAPSVRFSAFGDATGSVAARVGLLMRPLPGLTLQPGLEWRDGVVGVDVDGGGGVSGIGDVVVDGVRLGGVLQRGFVDAPLVEVELVRGLRLTLTTTWTWTRAPPSLRPGLGLTPLEQRYGAGLLLLF